jgi:hypothetical protein
VGLDATVYLNGHGAGDEDCADHKAVHRRLGNILTIGHIRKQASKTLSPHSIVLERVVQSGSHSGDEITLELIPRLREELSVLARDTDPAVQDFVRSMYALADGALEHSNPICF